MSKCTQIDSVLISTLPTKPCSMSLAQRKAWQHPAALLSPAVPTLSRISLALWTVPSRLFLSNCHQCWGNVFSKSHKKKTSQPPGDKHPTTASEVGLKRGINTHSWKSLRHMQNGGTSTTVLGDTPIISFVLPIGKLRKGIGPRYQPCLVCYRLS